MEYHICHAHEMEMIYLAVEPVGDCIFVLNI